MDEFSFDGSLDSMPVHMIYLFDMAISTWMNLCMNTVGTGEKRLLCAYVRRER